jgi:hypothetical protein
MAEGFLASGDRRSALRALYLGGLAGLARAGWVTLARHKSNREYGLELGRRGRDRPELSRAFGRLLAQFEPAWYGTREVTGEALDDVRSCLEIIRQCNGQTPAG